ncbi:hypothetical protein OKW21_002620 [Catalinimonas alkaloidigena]|uniref:hypothetical protein n=1 Tax=Catalinimonas alkaloidigena TaxID=1075417 RepID=UPI0024069B21|nr:hypothetical protein [Catalinimonas alkaloidigena]MDF9797357.1 hypothetical protein [Catalinimonas alkaloidigena]
MLIDIAIVFIAFLFSIPAVTGYFAYSHGKPFWKWFLIGCILPIIANFLIAYICRKEALKAQRRNTVELSRFEDEWMDNYVTKIIHNKSSEKKF